MKIYNNPSVEIVLISEDDILTLSIGDRNDKIETMPHEN